METILKNLIDSSDNTTFQKNMMKGIVERGIESDNQYNSDIKLITSVSNDKDVTIIFSTNELKIYKKRARANDSYSEKYPLKSIYFLNGEWIRNNTISPTLDTAILSYLGKKYLGENSQFTDFAMKMLEIKIED